VAAAGLVLAGLALAWLAFPTTSRAPTSRASAVTQMAVNVPTSKSAPRPTLPSPTAPLPTTPTTAGMVEKIIRGRAFVRDTILDPAEPDRNFGTVPKNNQVVRAGRSTYFLMYFDLAAAGVTERTKVTRAVLKFYVWDPHDNAVTRINVQALKTAWNETKATWRQPAEGQRWQGGDSFDPAADCFPPNVYVVVQPDTVNDVVDPPVEYQLDVTALYRLWFPGSHPNHGLALVPVGDRKIDDGRHSRFQMYASEHERVQYTPTLVLAVAREQ